MLVVEAGDGLALRLCGRLLADAGATVVRVPLPGSEGVPDALLAQPHGSGWIAFLDDGKEPAPAGGSTEELLDRAWLLLTGDHPDGPLGCAAALARHPRLIGCSVTPHGESGPRAGQPGDDVVASALSGLADATPGYPDMQPTPADPPVQSLAPLADAGGAYIAAAAAFGALLTRLRGRPGPRHVEISTVEAAASLMAFEWAQYAYGGPIRGRRPGLPDLAPNAYVDTADGTAALVAFTDPHWEILKGLMGSPAWADDAAFATSLERGTNWERMRPHLEEWLRTQPGQALMEAAQAREIPTCAAMRLRDTLTSGQVDATGAVVNGRIADPVVLGGRRRERLGRGGAALPPPEPLPGPAEAPLAGIRVLDLGQVVAGPWCGMVLAALGAEVTHVEPPGWPLSRRFGPFVAKPIHDASAVYNCVNRGKRSIQLDVKQEEGRATLRDLVRAHDVVFENFSRDAAEALGLGYDALRALRPDIVLASISGFGRSGPWGSYAAFHSGVLCLSGNADVTRDASGRMRLAGAIYPDFLSGTVTAFAIMQALALREQTGQGSHIELAMLDVMLTSMGGLAPAALAGTPFGAHPAHFETDGAGGWVADHAGLRSPVLDIAQMLSDEHHAARGFIITEEHPVAGPRTIASIPWQYDGTRPHLRHAPLLDGDRDATLQLAAEGRARARA